MNATTVPTQIAAFAKAVRAALSDLPADEVEELTEGLEADLTEAFSEDLRRELPDPAAYADELRIAAGLPMSQPARGRLHDVADSVRDLARDLNRSLRSNPAVAAMLDFAVSLRPAWWIVRGWAAYQCVGAVGGFEGDLLPNSPLLWMILAILVAGSVAVGLRRWPAWVRALIALGNAVAVIATVAGLTQVPTHDDVALAWNDADGYYQGYESGFGVTNGGMEVTNIFAYDSQGKPLNGVQLFDQDGQPIQTSTPGGNGCLAVAQEDGYCTPGAWVPTTLETGASVWNVYPMKMAESSDEDPTTPIAGAVPQDRPAPFLKVSALMSAIEKAPADAKNQEKAKKDR